MGTSGVNHGPSIRAEPGSGLYITHDGGEIPGSKKTDKDGLPKGVIWEE